MTFLLKHNFIDKSRSVLVFSVIGLISSATRLISAARPGSFLPRRPV